MLRRSSVHRSMSEYVAVQSIDAQTYVAVHRSLAVLACVLVCVAIALVCVFIFAICLLLVGGSYGSVDCLQLQHLYPDLQWSADAVCLRSELVFYL